MCIYIIIYHYVSINGTSCELKHTQLVYVSTKPGSKSKFQGKIWKRAAGWQLVRLGVSSPEQLRSMSPR